MSSWSGAFHGMIAPTTPTGSRTMSPNLPPIVGVASSRNGKVSAIAAYSSNAAAAWSAELLATLWVVPDSRGHTSARASSRSRTAVPSARRYSARSAWVKRGHGPSSNAARAASTARETSSAFASGTRNAISSVPASITSIVASDDGATQEPPMKNASGCVSGNVLERGMAVLLGADFL